jgi:hypothetical protein
LSFAATSSANRKWRFVAALFTRRPESESFEPCGEAVD